MGLQLHVRKLRRAAPVGGGGDPYAMRAPNGSDKFLNWGAGSDGTGTEGSPWNTLTSARMQAMTAGQAIFVRGTGAFPDTASGMASGTSSNRIYIAQWPGYTGGFTFTDDGARLGGGDYWCFHTLTLTCENIGLCTRTLMHDTGGSPSRYFRAVDCTGVRTVADYSDNTGIIFCTGINSEHSALGVEIIRGSYTGLLGGSGGNQALLFFDEPKDVLVLGVLLNSSRSPLTFKHTYHNDSGWVGGVVKNCIILNADDRCGLAANYVSYTNNAWGDAVMAMDLDGGGDYPGGNNCTITNNTFLDSNIRMSITGAGRTRENNVFRSNVLAGTTELWDNPYGADGNYDQNNFSDYSAVDSTARFYRNSSLRTLANHKAAFTSQEVNGVAGTVQLTGGTMTSPSYWALVASSLGTVAAGQAGYNGADRGVDASKLLTVD